MATRNLTFGLRFQLKDVVNDLVRNSDGSELNRVAEVVEGVSLLAIAVSELYAVVVLLAAVVAVVVVVYRCEK